MTRTTLSTCQLMLRPFCRHETCYRAINVHLRGQTNSNNLVSALPLLWLKKQRKDNVYEPRTPGAFSRLDLNDIMSFKTEVRY